MHLFTFSSIASPQGDADAWIGTARRAADQGFATFLVPDVPGLHAPFPALAVAATAVPGLRVGTFVLAAPLRSPRATAWEAATLSALTGGRFDLGIGTGRPDVRATAESFGLGWGTGAERLALVRATLDALDEHDPRPPVLIAASGPRALALAAERADVVTIASPPLTPRADVARTVADLRRRAGERDVRVTMNVFVVGDDAPPWAERFLGARPADLGDDSLAVLRGSPRAMADELQRRRDELGVSGFVADARYGAVLAPVVELLAGR